MIHNDGETDITAPGGTQTINFQAPVKEVDLEDADEMDEDLNHDALEQQKEDLATLERLAAAGQLEEIERSRPDFILEDLSELTQCPLLKS